MDKKWRKINYSQFVEYTDPRIVKLDCSNYGHDSRIVNKHNLWYAQNTNYISGYHTIRDLKYDIKVIEKNTKMINVTKFFTEKKESSQAFVKDVNQKQLLQIIIVVLKSWKIRKKIWVLVSAMMLVNRGHGKRHRGEALV